VERISHPRWTLCSTILLLEVNSAMSLNQECVSLIPSWTLVSNCQVLTTGFLAHVKESGSHAHSGNVSLHGGIQRVSCNMRKIRIPMASLHAPHNSKRVEEDQTIAIEAAIVRIMKARKMLQHTQLLEEKCLRSWLFQAQPSCRDRPVSHRGTH